MKPHFNRKQVQERIVSQVTHRAVATPAEVVRKCFFTVVERAEEKNSTYYLPAEDSVFVHICSITHKHDFIRERIQEVCGSRDTFLSTIEPLLFEMEVWDQESPVPPTAPLNFKQWCGGLCSIQDQVDISMHNVVAMACSRELIRSTAVVKKMALQSMWYKPTVRLENKVLDTSAIDLSEQFLLALKDDDTCFDS